MEGIFTANEQQAIDSLLRAGFEYKNLAPLLANISVETGGSFSEEQKQDGGPGRGMFQFEKGQLRDYNNFINDGENTKDKQAKFVHSNIYGEKGSRPHDLGWRARGMLSDSFKGQGSVQDKAQVFSEQYEKPSDPHLERRREEADRYNRLLFLNKVGL